MAEEKYVPRLKTKYNNEVKQQLQDKFQYENVMMIPKFEKIVVNMGVGEAATDSKAIDGAVRDLRAITGQQPMITRARKSIATFRLRAGMPIGCKVTLRGDRMWEFFDRLTSVAIPVSATSAASPPRASTAVVTSPWASPSSSSSRDRLRLRRSPAWYGHHFRDHRQHR